jgi:LmbE family N-acetylglucosaminyl deacetylase
VFAAHPDDETLGCGGTILKKASEGFEIIIVIMTDGRNSFSQNFGIISRPTPGELISIRKKELVEAARLLNVPENNLRFLDFEDGTLGDHTAEASKKVIEIIDEIKPIEVYFPYEKDSNRDHQAASNIIGDSIRSMGLSTLQYQYSIAQTFSRISLFLARLLNYMFHNLVFIDVSQFLGKKKAAIREFRSQTTPFADGQKRPVITDVGKFLKPKEMFYCRR